MAWLLNAVYLLGLLFLSPWLIYKAITTRKYRRHLLAKFLGRAPCLSSGQRVWFHGVSVGEIHLLRQVVARFRQRHPDWECVISTTTDTGLDEARKHFPELSVFYWPFDFSWAVQRALRQVRPSLVVLAESELWPNFLLAAKKQGVPVAIINGRMSPRSLRRFRRLRWLVRPLFASVDLIVAQTREYAAGYVELGAAPDRVKAIGNVKYDGVQSDRANPRTQELRRLLNIQDGELIWIAGSTQAPEEEIALELFRRLQADHPNLRLLLVPRQRDRFDEVAALLQRSGFAFVRRSEIKTEAHCPITLIDTIGELGALWGLADIAFVGGSLDGKRGGQNMIEPAAYGAAVVFGPYVWNFREDATRLVEEGGAIQIQDEVELEAIVRQLLGDVVKRQQLGEAARRLVLQQQGGTERTLDLIDNLLPHPEAKEHAA